MPQELTKADKVLLVLADLSSDQQLSVAYEDLVVAAFEAFPDDFALRGYPHYPDASDIHKPIYNTLRPQGLVRVARKTFKITDAGLARAAKARQDVAPTSAQAPRLTRSQERALRRYLSSAAARLVGLGRESDLVDTDCQRFYGFAPWSPPKMAAALRADFLATLAIALRVDEGRAAVLARTDRYLFETFSSLFQGIE